MPRQCETPLLAAIERLQLMNRLNNLKNILVVTIVASCLAPALLYMFVFAGYGLSKDTINWANFSIFLSIFLSLGNLIVFSLLTYAVHQYNLNKDMDAKRQIEVLNKPVLAFSKQAKSEYYLILNVGKSSALNVIVRSHLNHNKWQQVYLLYSIAANARDPLKWTTDCNALSAEYSDNFGNKYVSLMRNDYLTTIDCSDPGSLKKYKKEFELANGPSADPTWVI